MFLFSSFPHTYEKRCKENSEEQHPDVDLSTALTESIRSRRKTTATKDHRQRQRASFTTIERAAAPDLDVVQNKVVFIVAPPGCSCGSRTVSPTAMSPVCYDLQPESVK